MSKARGGGPKRTCVGCRAVKDKKELVRLVSKDGGLAVDKSGIMPGRGAYLCRSAACLEQALAKKGVFSRALKTNVSIIDQASLKAEIECEA